MKLIDADILILDLKNPDLCNVTPRILEIISEQPTVKPSVNPVNVLESILHSLKAKHMAEDMWEPVSPVERKKYRERYGAILKAVNVLEELHGGNKASNSTDAVNHPSHYSNGKYECIEVMKEVFGVEKVKAFCELNAFKYMWRSNKKNGTEDLKKARFYTDYLIKMEDADNEHERA